MAKKKRTIDKRTISALEDFKEIHTNTEEPKAADLVEASETEEKRWRLEKELRYLTPQDRAKAMWTAEIKALIELDSHSLHRLNQAGQLNAMFLSLIRCYILLAPSNEHSKENFIRFKADRDFSDLLRETHRPFTEGDKSLADIGCMFYYLMRFENLERVDDPVIDDLSHGKNSLMYDNFLYCIQCANADQWTALHTEIQVDSLRFLSTIRDFGGAYWENLFAHFFQSQLQFSDKKDLELLLSLPRELWNQDIGSSAKWLKEMADKGARRLNEARLILLGEKGSGKTSLARRLYDPNAEMPSEKESTEGVNISEFKLSVMSSLIPKELDAMVHVWDFAGHAITHAAHRFFLSERCVYVIVYDGRTEGRNRLIYWLDHVRNYGGNAKVLVLVNLKDGNRPDISENYIQKNYPEHRCEFYYFSIKNGGKALRAFREKLASMIAGGPAWDQQVPLSYYRVKERLEEKFAGKRDHITQTEFHEIATEIPEDERDIVLKNLTCLGICLWYPQLRDMNTLVLNPEWITKGVYRIINWLQNKKSAVVALRDFEQIFQKEQAVYPQDKHRFLYQLIQEYELAYSDGRKIVVPQCLPQDRPASDILPEFPPETSLSTVIQAKSGEGSEESLLAFPPDVMPRFIVRRSEELSGNKKLIWRFGTMLELGGGTFALVQQDDYAIRLQVMGTDKTEYFAELLNELLDLLRGYEGLQRYQPTPSYSRHSKDGKLNDLLSHDQACNLLRNIPLEMQSNYFDPRTNMVYDMLQFSRSYGITMNVGCTYNSNDRHDYRDDHSMNITYNYNQCNMDLQDSLRVLARELPAGSEADELRAAATLLGEVESCKSPEDIKKQGVLPRLSHYMSRLGDALRDENSTLHKVVSGVTNVVALAGKALGAWNQMAQWCGWPPVPGV